AGLERDWLDVQAIVQIKAWLEESLAAVAGLYLPEWQAYVQEYLDLADQHHDRALAGHLGRRLRQALN
ncbi:MAG: hypothetical protein ACRDHL_14000, partial [Candidatus Promineifilaceae bacterium]